MIAYLILVHRYPKQFKRLFNAIYDPGNYYLVHVDKNSGSELDDDIHIFLADFPNSAVLKGKNILWGGYSLVDAELRGMSQLLKMGKDWKYFINLSGQDFPLKNQQFIIDYLSKNPDKEFIKVLDQQKIRPETMHRIKRYVVEFHHRIFETSMHRKFMVGVTPYIGNQWMIVSRAFCHFVCHDPLADRYKAFYTNTYIADEGFFQTVMMNTEGHGEIVNDDLRLIDWVEYGDVKLRPRTFTSVDISVLITSSNLFARKFDMNVDVAVFDALEDHLQASAITRSRTASMSRS